MLMKRHCFLFSFGYSLSMILLIITLMKFPFKIHSLRHKEIDENYQQLIPLSQIPKGCEHVRGIESPSAEPSKEYGFVEVEDIGLEKCRVYLDEEKSAISDENGHYERYKCKHLRSKFCFSRIPISKTSKYIFMEKHIFYYSSSEMEKLKYIF